MDGVVERWNDGELNEITKVKEKRLTEISALFESRLFPLDKGRSYLQRILIGISALMDLYGVLDQFLITTTIYIYTYISHIVVGPSFGGEHDR